MVIDKWKNTQIVGLFKLALGIKFHALLSEIKRK